ncbi:isoaspartyl peptidase/L-asparaginase family protein [Lignipirellula cremea]|uniref:Isoaspartyl peptidase n=1 Tax=Lignipirellula cremea TaxID=2528010 RepID=A0A518DV34_9BACT|nr:isoaspartyl peptidase/L-asparaginase [Lignipirellula cremea]QDU95684.1 Isoaspartyl peptidase precursor [Lignipirellula cremea]
MNWKSLSAAWWLVGAAVTASPAAETPSIEYALVIHGGARGSLGGSSEEEKKAQEKSLEQALSIGLKILANGGEALDAVEQTILHLENDPLFNAGRGAVYNSEGGHELDASLMDGRTRACGAVAGVTTVKNPIGLARLVMTKTRHVLLAGAGAERFADEMHVERVENSYFDTPQRREDWRRVQQDQKAAEDSTKGTVGCVALDRRGNLAAGTSTGGLTNKKFGRVGDSPIIGAGTYAQNSTCGVSCTGTGEEFIRNAVAYQISARMQFGHATLADAVEQVVQHTLRRGDGGVIAIDHRGRMSMQFNTPGMARGWADSTGKFQAWSH